MTSPARVAANVINAKKSTEPRTASGKERSRMNAVSHGLTARIALFWMRARRSIRSGRTGG